MSNRVLYQCPRLLVASSQCRRHLSNNNTVVNKKGSWWPKVTVTGGLVLGATAAYHYYRPTATIDQKIKKLIGHIGVATMHLHQGENGAAKKQLELGLQCVKNEVETRGCKIDNESLAFHIDHLANIAVQCEEYQTAVTLYKVVVEGFVRLGVERNDRFITDYLLKIAQLYALSGQNRKAEVGFVHVITVTTHELTNTAANHDERSGILAGHAYEGLGKLYLSMGETENALNCYNHALDFTEKYSGPMDHHIPILMQEISKVYQTLGRLEEALAIIYQAELLGAKSQPLFNQRIVLERAKLLQLIGNLDEAKAVYTEVKEACIAHMDQETLAEVTRCLSEVELDSSKSVPVEHADQSIEDSQSEMNNTDLPIVVEETTADQSEGTLNNDSEGSTLGQSVAEMSLTEDKQSAEE